MTPAALMAFLTKPTYQATAVLLPVSDDGGGSLSALMGQFGGLASLAGVSLGGGNQRAEAVAVLRSQDFGREFIRRHGLMPRLFASRWDASTKSWKGQDESKWPTMNRAWQTFDRNIRRVTEDRKTGLITLEVRWRNPQEAADWANWMAQDLNASMRQRAIDESERMLSHMRTELDAATHVELRAAVSRLMEVEMKKALLARSRTEFAVRAIDRAQVADVDQYVWPRRGLLLAGGLALGLLVGGFAALVTGSRSRSGNREQDRQGN